LTTIITPERHVLVQSESFSLESKVFSVRPCEQPGRVYRRPVTVSSLSDILQGTFERLN
jgi:hypothetical protein